MITGKQSQKKVRPASTPEGRENQIIAAAMDWAMEQILNKNVSAQVLTFFLKLATGREKLEREKLKNENLLLSAKVGAIHDSKKMEDLVVEALNAMRRYTGQEDSYDD